MAAYGPGVAEVLTVATSQRRNSPASGDQGSDTAQKLDRLPIANGRLVDVSIPAAGVMRVPHGLDRPYAGAFVVGQSQVGLTFVVAHPEFVTGLDPRKDVQLVISGAAAFPVRLRLWVF
jgi:hypothetical protein